MLGALLLLTISFLMLRANTAEFYGLMVILAIVGISAFIAWVADA